MISFISSFEIVFVFIPYPEMFFQITVSVADASAVNPNGIKTLLADGLSTFSTKGKPVFSNSPKSVPRNRPDCPIFFYLFLNFL